MSKLDALLRHVAEEQDAQRAASTMAERLAKRFHGLAPAPRRRAPVWLVLAAAASVLGLLAGVAVLRQPATLAVSIAGSGQAPLGTWLGAPDSSSLPLDFSDGSRFELTPKSRARVVELSNAKSRVELASGSLRVHVVPGGTAEWRIDAGPFGVRVTGTRFVVSYVPSDDTFELSLDEGQVDLTGCVFGTGRKLTAGQRVRASCRAQALEVSYRDTHFPNVSPPTSSVTKPPALLDATSTGAAAPAAPPHRDQVPPASTSPSPTWFSLANAGRYRDAYALVERDGFDAECSRGTTESLLLLADVARHARAPRQAEKALLTLRRRFAGGADAALAAFNLGRLEFDEFRAYPAAASWFRTYLRERPRGTMAREALGRLMEALQRAGDAEGSRATAEQYLRDYPSGPHAELASRLVPAP